MKKSMVLELCVLMSVWCFSSATAAVTHLDVDFSDYTLGDVKGQSGTVSGDWIGGDYWTGTVVSVSEIQALEVFSVDGSSSATRRGSVPLGSSLSLESADKIYMSLDVYGKDPNGDLDIMLSTGSFGTIANLSFGLWYNGTDDGIKFASSTAGGSLVRKDTAFMLTEDTWTRFEYEITQSAVAGVGTFSVFVSTEGGGSRTAIFEEEAYSFTMTSLATLNVVPIAVGTTANAVAINNLVVQSGLTEFVANPVDKPVTTIISLSHYAGNVLEMVVDCPTPSTSYPRIKTDLVTGSWGGVGHSTSSGGPFAINNLGTIPGTTTIYLEANDVAAFYGIGEE